ncbi:hypothetical protein [Pedobacter sp. MW01-1-1]|uniref:hypothetical protein n=1 Tax=Pedobacter sp. MW01-1-1 TaxID=3383027 RepID=UPI003FF05577
MNTNPNVWGLTRQESLNIQIGASKSNSTWTAVLLSVTGNYSVQGRLIPGCSEIGESNSVNYCTQVQDLKTLGNANGLWYMLSAVQAHENVHVSRGYPALQNILYSTRDNVINLTVPDSGQSKSQAISELTSLANFQLIQNNALANWRIQCDLYAVTDHANNGPCDLAEHAIVDPIGVSICNLTNTYPSWPICTSCPY